MQVGFSDHQRMDRHICSTCSMAGTASRFTSVRSVDDVLNASSECRELFHPRAIELLAPGCQVAVASRAFPFWSTARHRHHAHRSMRAAASYGVAEKTTGNPRDSMA